jgi:hypothetical protein
MTACLTILGQNSTNNTTMDLPVEFAGLLNHAGVDEKK